MYNIIGKSKIWLTVSGFLVLTSIIFLALWGFKLGIDFTGGSILEVSYSKQRPTMEQGQSTLAPLELGSLKYKRAVKMIIYCVLKK